MRNEKGNVAVELAVISPFVLFLTFGAIIIILAAWSKIITVDAAREGARHQALGLGSAYEKVDETLRSGGLNPARLQDIKVDQNENYISVELLYKQPSIIPGLPALVGGKPWDTNFLIKGAAVFKIEKPN